MLRQDDRVELLFLALPSAVVGCSRGWTCPRAGNSIFVEANIKQHSQQRLSPSTFQQVNTQADSLRGSKEIRKNSPELQNLTKTLELICLISNLTCFAETLTRKQMSRSPRRERKRGAEKSIEGKLRIEVFSGRKLTDKAVIGTQSPYLVLKIGGKRLVTKVRYLCSCDF